MRRFYLIGFLVLMSFDTLAQLSFKYAAINAMPLQADLNWLVRVFSHIWVYGALVGYIGAFFTWMTLLKHAPIGPAFAVSHLEVISIMVCSVWLFNETLSLVQIGGAALIFVGIMCLAVSEGDAAKAPVGPALL